MQMQQQQLIHPMDSMPKKGDVDRLARRINDYRLHHSNCGRRFDETFNGACQQQNLETTALKKRFLANKARKIVQKTDKCQPDTVLTNNGSVHVVSNWVLQFVMVASLHTCHRISNSLFESFIIFRFGSISVFLATKRDQQADRKS